MKFIATGDTIVTEYYTRDYAGYQEICEFVRTADVRFNNMETPLVDDWCRVSSFPVVIGCEAIRRCWIS